MKKKIKGKQAQHLATKTSRSVSESKIFFDELLTRYNRRDFLHSDPIQFPHRYNDPKDQEVAAFIAALFAYGSVNLIARAVETILKPLGESPAKALRAYTGRENLWPGFYHRFHNEKHLVVLLKVTGGILREHGSLGIFFEKCYLAGGRDMEGMLNHAAHQLWDVLRAESSRSPELWQGLRFLINAPEGGSACKRMVMFLRWMVRKDEIDFGLWTWMKPSELLIPVDTHIARFSHQLKLRKGTAKRAVSWAMAKEITTSLRQLNPDDPVCYDFCLTRVGIIEKKREF